jgi:iron(II)-dependent oxidoreductase
MGAPDDRFSYDNERPAHDVELPAYRIGRTAITNATFLRFVEGGGYQRREWWSDEGWAWKEEYDITHPQGWAAGPDGWRQWRIDGDAPLHPEEPVVHISWFEADALARAHGARLPTEAEWEKAATWTQKRRGEAGDEPPGEAVRRPNLGQTGLGPHPVGSGPAGAPLGMFGDTWEWTATEFDGYPGFVAHPYREYSEVFFRRGHRVLRGGSWATQPRVATPTFRNWDLPQRRQIFSGVRLAWDAQPESTGSSAPSLTSVSASSAAGSESRTTPTPA